MSKWVDEVHEHRNTDAVDAMRGSRSARIVAACVLSLLIGEDTSAEVHAAPVVGRKDGEHG